MSLFHNISSNFGAFSLQNEYFYFKSCKTIDFSDILSYNFNIATALLPTWKQRRFLVKQICRNTAGMGD